MIAFVLALTMAQSAPRPVVIVALGDSTTAGTPGWESSLEAAPRGKGNAESQYAFWLMKVRPGWYVMNHGINGERSDQIHARFERDVVAARPAVVVIIAGVNDVYQGRSAESVIKVLQAMYDRARAAGIRVVAGTIVPFNTASQDQNARMHAVNDWIRGAPGRDSNVTVADTRAAAADPKNPDLLLSSPDQLHPSVDGYRRMAEAIQPAIEAALKHSGSAR